MSGTVARCGAPPTTTAHRIPKATSTGAEPPAILYWALGGGHGHAVRGIAVLDRLARRAPGLRTALAAPGRHARWCSSRGITLWSPPDGVRERAPLAAWAASLPQPRRLVSDVFPRGVLGELAGVLPRLSRPAWLVSRRVRPRAWLAPDVRAAIESRYERLFWCEEPPPELVGVAVAQRRVGPVLIQRPDECLDAEAARAALELPVGAKVVLMLGSGSEHEQREALRLLLKVRARLIGRGSDFRLVVLSARLPPTREANLMVIDAFPAMRLLRAATLLIAGGGYASWHEVNALGVPALFLPQARPWDDQAGRVAASQPPESPQALEAEIAQRLLHPPPPPAARPTSDGADAIASALLEAD